MDRKISICPLWKEQQCLHFVPRNEKNAYPYIYLITIEKDLFYYLNRRDKDLKCWSKKKRLDLKKYFIVIDGFSYRE